MPVVAARARGVRAASGPPLYIADRRKLSVHPFLALPTNHHTCLACVLVLPCTAALSVLGSLHPLIQDQLVAVPVDRGQWSVNVQSEAEVAVAGWGAAAAPASASLLCSACPGLWGRWG